MSINMRRLWQHRAAVIKEKIETGCPVIFGGDFNVKLPGLHSGDSDSNAGPFIRHMANLPMELL